MSSSALVLGGGGSTGNAWLIGVLAGLTEVGYDLDTFDRVIGTSAGATAAVQVSGTAPADLLSEVGTTAVPPGPARPVTVQLERMKQLIAGCSDAADMRRRMGAAALERAAASDGLWQDQWRATVASRFPLRQWPMRQLLLTAVDARTGEGVAFEAASGVDLVDAVAASCSSGIPYWIGDRAFIDGGFKRNENADLAAGCDRVLVLSPLGGKTLHPLEWGMQLAVQVDELEAAGSQVVTVVPREEDLFGANAMNLSLRPAAARLGYDQGLALTGLWD